MNLRAIGLGFAVGALYQVPLVLLQPVLEPKFVWFQVVVGTVLALLQAEILTTRQDRLLLFYGYKTISTWREYRNTLLGVFVGMGIPIITYELINHVLLGRAV